MSRVRLCRRAFVASCTLTALAAPSAHAATTNPIAPDAQARLILKSQERTSDFASAEFRRLYVPAAARRTAEQAAIPLADPERLPLTVPCTVGAACVGDVRLDRWAEDGHGIVRPVLFTARDGATLSGRMWATRSGPAKRPLIVIINGSVIGFEEYYWWAAQSLAKAGYVVMTFDTQGEGRSDQLGVGPDLLEAPIAGTPPIGSGLPFYDGGEDALDFALSTPDKPYVPAASRTTGTSHADKQERRVKAGLDTAYNPLWNMVDPARIGIAGHSYGSIAASYLAQSDPRISAAVAWDSLCVPKQPAPLELADLTTPGTGVLPGAPTVINSFGKYCFGAPPGPEPKLTKPALGITGDYLLAPAPYLSKPNPLHKSRASLAYSVAGVDTGQLVIRGGTHYEYGYFPSSALPATLRGIDLVAWYTAAWFDKYLRKDPTADSRLLSARWRDDAANGKADRAHDANLYSELYTSRIDIHASRGGARIACEDLRAGCASLVPAADDCGAPSFRYLAVARTDDGADPLLRAACSATAKDAAAARRRAAARKRARMLSRCSSRSRPRCARCGRPCRR
jgi:dienelactone hydrolase